MVKSVCKVFVVLVVGNSCRIVSESFLEVFASAIVVGGNHNERQKVVLEFAAVLNVFQSVKEYVDTFVSVFVATACAKNLGAVGEFLIEHFGCHFEHNVACGLTFLVEHRAFGNEVIFKSVGCNDVNLALGKLLTLLSGDVAHGGVSVGGEGREFFAALFCHHTKLTCFFVAVV